MSWKNLVFRLEPGALFYRAVTCQALWRAQVRAMVGLAQGETAEARGLRVLDLGCGAGVSSFELAAALPAASVVGLDVSPVMLRAATQALQSKFEHLQERVAFQQCDAGTLPFADGSFDVVAGHSFLYLVDDPEAVLAEARRVLAPGGQLLLMEPATEGTLWSTLRRAREMLAMLVKAPWTAFRFAFAIVHWRMLAVGFLATLSRPTLEAWLTQAGYREVHLEPAIGGLGWHVVART